MYRAIWRIKHNNKIYEPGDILTGLSDEQIKELLSMRAIQIQPSFNDSSVQTQEIKKEDGLIDEIAAFYKTLQAMKRPELLAYAKKVNVEVDLKMKNSEICDLLLEDAKQNGVDIESFDDQSLNVFAVELGCEVTREMNREQVIAAIDERLDGGNHE